MPVVLFVDDEPLSQKYFRASVSPFAEVLTASNPVEARQILALRNNEIDVVVSDERMPHETGVPFLSDVRRNWPKARRVLTSAYADVENLQDAINDAAIFQFVPKPWDLDQLRLAVHNALSTRGVPHRADGDSDSDLRDAELAVFARSLEQPLQALEIEAMQLMALTGTGSAPSAALSPASLGTWASQVRMSQISTAASRLHEAAAACLTLASAMAGLSKTPRNLQ